MNEERKHEMIRELMEARKRDEEDTSRKTAIGQLVGTLIAICAAGSVALWFVHTHMADSPYGILLMVLIGGGCAVCFVYGMVKLFSMPTHSETYDAMVRMMSEMGEGMLDGTEDDASVIRVSKTDSDGVTHTYIREKKSK